MKTWDDIETFDDIILPEVRSIIVDLEKELAEGSRHKCPYLSKEGNFFYYCGLKVSEEVDKKPVPSNPIYQNYVEPIELQLYCMDSFEDCCSNKKSNEN